MRVHVIGGGVIGMMTARELALAGVEVVLLERGRLGAEASWAGGGIMSPLYPWRHPAAVDAMAQLSQRLYPGLVQSLFADTGIDPQWQACGMLMLDVEDLLAAQSWAQQRQVELQLFSDRPGTVLMPQTAHIRNPRLLAALAADLQRRGVLIEQGAEVVAFELDGQRLKALRLADGRVLSAQSALVCAGAWAGQLLRPLGWSLPVYPVQGQMICYAPAPISRPEHMIMRASQYIIPRRDGHLLVGSTLEHRDFHKVTTLEARAQLIEAAEQLWPPLRGYDPVAHWAGLRPGSAQGIPTVAASPCQGLWVHAGHFRNGLVLAPASSRLLVDLLLQRPPCLPSADYAWPASAGSSPPSS